MKISGSQPLKWDEPRRRTGRIVSDLDGRLSPRLNNSWLLREREEKARGWERTEYFANVRTRYACFGFRIVASKQVYRVRTLAKYSVLSQPLEKKKKDK